MSETARNPLSPGTFIGSEKNLDRLTRIGWEWSTSRVKKFKSSQSDQTLMRNIQLPLILEDKHYQDYLKALGWSGGCPLGESGGGPLGWSGGGVLGWSGGGPLGRSGGRPLGTRVLRGFGYHRDLPDWRDHKIGEPDIISEDVRKILYNIETKNRSTRSKRSPKSSVGRSYLLMGSNAAPLPDFQDLRFTGNFSPIEHQGDIGSCTAQAIIGLVEYLQRSGLGMHEEMSRLFNYKTSRRLLGWTGDTGAYLRTAIKALALFGAPPEKDWPYDTTKYDDEPLAYHYAYGQNFKAINYTRLDTPDTSPKGLLDLLKRTLLDGFPVVFGFTVYKSIQEVGYKSKFVIPFPNQYDKVDGGHAVVAVGYDDNYLDEVPFEGGSKGAIIIRNSWGTSWGEAGYGYLPEEYVTQGLAQDFWTIFNQDWFDQSVFE